METASGTLTRELNATAPGPGPNVCRHYWLIEAANGPASMGKCKYCHAERQFQNSLRDAATIQRHHADEYTPVARTLAYASRRPIA